MALVTPETYPSSVSVVADTAIFCDALETTALLAVSDSVSMVVADPVIVACLALI
jgi:thiamine biosynthesis lipoprotein ApbE